MLQYTAIPAISTKMPITTAKEMTAASCGSEYGVTNCYTKPTRLLSWSHVTL